MAFDEETSNAVLQALPEIDVKQQRFFTPSGNLLLEFLVWKRRRNQYEPFTDIYRSFVYHDISGLLRASDRTGRLDGKRTVTTGVVVSVKGLTID